MVRYVAGASSRSIRVFEDLFGDCPTTLSTAWPPLKKSRVGSHNPIPTRNVRILIRIELHHLELAVILRSKLVYDGPTIWARPTPHRPKIDQYEALGLVNFRAAGSRTHRGSLLTVLPPKLLMMMDVLVEILATHPDPVNVGHPR